MNYFSKRISFKIRCSMYQDVHEAVSTPDMNDPLTVSQTRAPTQRNEN